jgi:drug/metabolite transporter (DMT)-like permease
VQEASTTANQRTRIWVALLIVWVVWGSTYLGIAVTVTTMPPLLSNALRFFAAALILATVLIIMRGPSALRVTRIQLAYSALMGCALLGVGIGTLALAERYLPSGIAALIIAIMPLWIVILRATSGDRPSRLTLAGVAIGMGGLALMMLPGGTTPVMGTAQDLLIWSLAMVGSSFCWAFFSWRSVRFPLPKDALVTTTYELLAAGCMLLAVGAVTGEELDLSAASLPSLAGWSWLVLASVVAYTCYSWLIANAPLSLVSTYAYVNPGVAVLLGWLILREPITSDVLLGLTLVLSGVILVTRGERDSGETPAPPEATDRSIPSPQSRLEPPPPGTALP